jgi:hypothetical protein
MPDRERFYLLDPFENYFEISKSIILKTIQFSHVADF